MAETYPYRPGTTIRTGYPWSWGSGSPFIPTAINESRSSVRASIGVEAVKPSMERESTMSAPSLTPTRSSSVRTGTPSHVAFPARSPPTVLETQVSVTCFSIIGSASSCSNVSVSSRSTSPWIRSSQVVGSTRGTARAVSIR